MRPIAALPLALSLLAATPSARAAMPPAPPYLSSGAAVLIDATSGEVLFARSGYVRRSPASTTKLLTALVAVREGDLGQIVRISPQVDAVPGSSAHLAPGQRFTLRELLEGMLMRSGNDAAHAIAGAVGGDQERFAQRMNRTAAAIGARQTHFVNPHGLTAKHHFTSGRDLARIARVALEEPEIARIVASQELTLKPEDGPGRAVRNTNQLLGSYLGADGAKTGTTDAAGKCLVASARREGVHLIAVVLKGGDRYGDARRLLDWGFRRDGGALAIPRGRVVAHLQDGRPLRLTAPLAGTALDGVPLRLRFAVMEKPPRDGGVVGAAVLRRGGEVLASAALEAPPRPRGWLLRHLLPSGAGAVDRDSLHSL